MSEPFINDPADRDDSELTREEYEAAMGGTPAMDHQAEITKISEMSHFDMCALWRFSPSGHPYFDSSLPFYEVFRARLFDHFGGFTPAISKSLSP